MGALVVGYLYAQATGSEPNLWAMLASLGIGGLVALPFAYSWREERKRGDRLEKVLLEQMLPASADLVHATRDILDFLRSRQR